ncbi:complexin-3-like [Scomber japonicus]|uniref:complexin-3-like n=1 Tax=Scomber japonicus TaxID=13676 RepID=UPI002304F586|nr:complexin-3-like [Scomber japonicus]
MESVVRVKKSLRKPVRKLTSCVTGVKERKGGCSKLGRTPPRHIAHAKDASVIRSYQADLEKERQLREAKNAQKNAERATVRAHFRRKYRLSENCKDSNHMRTVGGKMSLPHELSKIIHPETKTKDNGFDLLQAFQGLNFNTAALTGKKHSKPTPKLVRGQSCKVM